jgi:hypothetical protein
MQLRVRWWGPQFRYWRVSGGRNHHAGLNDGHGRTGSWQRADQGACAGVWGISRTADQQEFSHAFRARGCGVGEGPLCGRLCRGAGSQGLQNTLTYSPPTPEEVTGVGKPQPCPVSVRNTNTTVKSVFAFQRSTQTPPCAMSVGWAGGHRLAGMGWTIPCCLPIVAGPSACLKLFGGANTHPLQ